MGLQVLGQLPSGEGELIAVRNLPISIIPSDSFNAAKAALDEMVRQAGGLAESIQTDDQYNQAIEFIKQLRRFLKDVEAGAKTSKDSLNSAKNQLMEFIHQLDEPATKLEKALARETGRYLQWKEEQTRKENERRAREAEEARQREQRRVDLEALTNEVAAAEREAVAAEERQQPETAKEIRQALKRFAGLASSPGAFQDPLGDATRVRQAVAFAKQKEEGRIAAAKLKAEGNKSAAKKVEAAAAKAHAPEVAAVVSEKVETRAVVVPKADLNKVTGQFLKKTWKVKRVFNPDVVPRQFLVVSDSLLKDYAKRLGTKPEVPGVEFEEDVKTAGIRS